MIFAAGLGTRLKPITDSMPKALVPVNGTPLIDIVLTRVIEAGATEVVVNVHHFAEQIVKHLATKDWEIPISISDESAALLDTGGGLRKAAQLFTNDESPILVHNVDILSNANLKNFYEQSKDNDATLFVSERNTQRYLLFDQSGNLCGWTNIATGEIRSPYKNLKIEETKKQAFSGIHCISPRLLKYMDQWPTKFSIIDFYLSLCNKVNIKSYTEPHFKMLDVGKIETLREAAHWLQNRGKE